MRHPFRQRWTKKLVLAEAPLPADPRHTQSVTRARILPRGSVPRLPHSVRYQPRRDQQRLIQDSKLLPSKLPPAPGPFPFNEVAVKHESQNSTSKPIQSRAIPCRQEGARKRQGTSRVSDHSRDK